jgi:hypothetical protein
MKELTILDSKFRIHECGNVERQLKSGRWKIIQNTPNHNQGYNVILIQNKQYMRSRIIAMAYLILDEKKVLLHHKDGNRLNCALSNLSIENYKSIKKIYL